MLKLGVSDDVLLTGVFVQNMHTYSGFCRHLFLAKFFFVFQIKIAGNVHKYRSKAQPGRNLHIFIITKSMLYIQ